MSKLNEKKKNRSGIDKHKIKQLQGAEEKLHLLKAAKQEGLKKMKKMKKAQSNDSETNVLDRFKKKSKK